VENFARKLYNYKKEKRTKMALIKITNDNFEQEVLKSDIPVLIDFWAGWCAPCKTIEPYVEEIAGEYEGKLKVGKLNVDEHPQIAMNYGIRAIPALLLFRAGKVVDMIMGAMPKQTIINKVKEQVE